MSTLHPNQYYYSGSDILQTIRVGPVPESTNKPAPIQLIARLPSEDCGCPEEVWQIDGLWTVIHMEEDGKGEVFIYAGDWEDEKSFDCKNLDELRAKMFGWIAEIANE